MILTALLILVYVSTEVVLVAVSKTFTSIVEVSIVMSGITYICESAASPTKNVLVLIVPSKTDISGEPASSTNS